LNRSSIVKGLILSLFVTLISAAPILAQQQHAQKPQLHDSQQSDDQRQDQPHEQQPQSDDQQRHDQQSQSRREDQQTTGAPTFRADTTDVLVPTLVTDQQGNVIFGLTAKDFIIRDNGVEQTPRMDESFSTKPVSLVLAVQTGGRAPQIVGSGCALQRGSNEFTRPSTKCKSTLHGIALMLETFVDAPGSQMALVSFDSTVKLRQDFTSNISNVTAALDRLPGGDGDGAVLDAVQFSLNLLKRRAKDERKVLVVISEQKDHGSKTVTLDEAARQIIASDVEVYMVAYPPDFTSAAESVAKLFGPASSPIGADPTGMPGPGGAASAAGSINLLGLMSLLHSSATQMNSNVPQSIANLTGGEYVLFHNEKGLDEALGKLANHAHNRYQLSFTAKNPQPGPHRIEVLLREGGGAQISARAGYWPLATSASTPQKP
jgi:VWFA-related protein